MTVTSPSDNTTTKGSISSLQTCLPLTTVAVYKSDYLWYIYYYYFYLQRHTLFVQSGVHYVVLGNGLHPQQDHDKRRQEVDMKQCPKEKEKGKVKEII